MYYLLPFRFERTLNYEILVNEVGDYLIVPLGTAQRIVEKNIYKEDYIYKDLIANFFISESVVPPLIDNWASRYRTKKSFLDTFTALHIFVLTLRCNQNCIYCQAYSRQCDVTSSDISFEDLSAAIDLMFQSPSPSITMEFQGGEPTLVYDRLKFAVERANILNEKFQKKISYVICTNSINLSDELLGLCKLYNILISTSLDGPEFLHNENRSKSDSYKKVTAGIQKARSYLGYDNVSALMTTSNESLKYPREIIDSYRYNGFNNIFLRALNPYGLATDNNWKPYTDNFIAFYMQALNYIIELNLKGEFFVEDYTALLLKKILTPFCIGFVDLQSPAGIINSVIVYNYDGYVYASDESRMLAEKSDFTFQLGHVTDPYNKIFFNRKVGEIAQTWANETIAGCSDCAFQAYCGADPVRNYSTQHDMYGYRPSSLFCYKNKEIINHLFYLIHNRPEVLTVFKSWINRF